jgi:hypothetical protein
MKKIFISYRHTSDDFKRRVKELADWLVDRGFECILDVKWLQRNQAWPEWAKEQILTVDWVFPICDKGYKEIWLR